MMRRFTKFFAVLLAAAVLVHGYGVHAQEAKGGLKPFPEPKKMTVEEFLQQTTQVRVTVPEDPTINIDVQVPKGWIERQTAELKNNIKEGMIFGDISRFDGQVFEDSMRPYFLIRALDVTREISAHDWLISYTLQNAFTLRSIKPTEDDRSIEGIYISQKEDGAYAVYVSGRISGPRIILTEFSVPIRMWEQLVDLQVFSMRSVKFRNTGDAPIEGTKREFFSDKVKLSFPSSWYLLEREVSAANRVNFTLISRGDTGVEQGRIMLSVVGYKSIVDPRDNKFYDADVPVLVKEVRDRVEGMGYLIEKTLENKLPELTIATDFLKGEVYSLAPKLTDYNTMEKSRATRELWMVVFRGKDNKQVYVASLYGPARTEDLYAWAVNMRGFEIFLKALQ